MSNEDKVFYLQRAQRLGFDSETAQCVLEKNQQKAKFDSWNLDKKTIVGLNIKLPNTEGSKSETGAALLTKAQVEHGVLVLSHTNKAVFKIPLRMLETEGKNLVYVPIRPISNLDRGQSFITFHEVSQVEGNIEVYFVTE